MFFMFRHADDSKAKLLKILDDNYPDALEKATKKLVFPKYMGKHPIRGETV